MTSKVFVIPPRYKLLFGRKVSYVVNYYLRRRIHQKPVLTPISKAILKDLNSSHKEISTATPLRAIPLGSLSVLPTYTSAADRVHHEFFFRQVFDLILRVNVFEGLQRTEKVCKFKTPEEFLKIFEMEVGQLPVKNTQALVDLVRQVSCLSVKTSHPYFFNQLYSGLDPYGLMGEIVAATLNTNVTTYEESPLFSLMEFEVLEKLRKIIGFPQGKGDGIVCGGSSLANGYAINTARHRKRPNVKDKGMFGGKALVMFVSEDSYLWFKKFASFTGIGSDNVISVKVDGRGKMIIHELEQEIEKAITEDKEPFLVVGTAGTAALGAFDSLQGIDEVCKKFDLWFHVDAAYGGGIIFSDSHKELLKGIEQAHSVAFSPHHILCAPQSCSFFLCREEGVLKDCHGTDGPLGLYSDKFYNGEHLDFGDKYVTAGRRPDILKFWLMWKAKGIRGFGRHVDHLFSLRDFIIQDMKKRGHAFRLILNEPEGPIISFWYIPHSLRNLDTGSTEFNTKIHSATKKMKERMVKAGFTMVHYQSLREYPNFFRLAVQNSSLTEQDMIVILDLFGKFGDEL